MKLAKLTRWLPFGKVPELDALALAKALDSAHPPRLLDVRSTTEWELSRINGALSFPITELRSRLGELPFTHNEPLVAICLTAHRSIPAVRLLQEAGYKNVRQLKGGMLKWWDAGLPVANKKPG